MNYCSENLLIKANHPEASSSSALLNSVSAEEAGWELLNFGISSLESGVIWGHNGPFPSS